MFLPSTALHETDFRPVPLLGNAHVQTVLGVFLPGRSCPPTQRRHRVDLGDGDALLLHENTPDAWKPGDPAALLVHGLTGDHASPYMRRMAAQLLDRGVSVFRIDLRGVGLGWPWPGSPTTPADPRTSAPPWPICTP